MKRIFLLCVAMASMSALMAQGASQSKSTAQLFGEATDLFRKEKLSAMVTARPLMVLNLP